MDGLESEGFGEETARKILDGGWRQGSLLRPQSCLTLPSGFAVDAASELLVVCTQSCSLVSPSLKKDPTVELVVGTPSKLDAFKAAARNYRSFHLAVSGLTGFTAVECDVNRRCVVPRSSFATISPIAGVSVQQRDARKFAVWLGHYYMRAALPNALVGRMRGHDGRNGIVGSLKEILAPKGTLHVGVEGLYVNWEPDVEILDGAPYQLGLRVLCTDLAIQEELERRLDDAFEPYTGAEGMNGIRLTCNVQNVSQAFVSDLNGYVRFSELDYLSEPGDVAEAYDRPVGS